MRKYLAILLLAYRNHHVYIYDVLGTNIIFVLRVIVIITLYRVIFEMSGGKALISGHSFEQLSWALIITQALASSKPRTSTEVSEEIKSWRVVVHLLNPVSYVWFKFFSTFSRFLGNIVPALGIGFVIGCVFLWFPSTSIAWVVGGLALILGGMMVTFFGYMLVGLCAFFMEDSEALRWIYSKLDMILGGNMLPLPFLPPLLQSIAFASPFAASGYTAGLIFVGFDLHRFGAYFLIQIIWIAIYILACLAVYEYARRRLVVNGG